VPNRTLLSTISSGQTIEDGSDHSALTASLIPALARGQSIQQMIASPAFAAAPK